MKTYETQANKITEKYFRLLESGTESQFQKFIDDLSPEEMACIRYAAKSEELNDVRY